MEKVFIVNYTQNGASQIKATFTNKNEAEKWIESETRRNQDKLIQSMDELYRKYIAALVEGKDPVLGNFGTYAVQLANSRNVWSIQETYLYHNSGEASV